MHYLPSSGRSTGGVTALGANAGGKLMRAIVRKDNLATGTGLDGFRGSAYRVGPAAKSGAAFAARDSSMKRTRSLIDGRTADRGAVK